MSLGKRSLLSVVAMLLVATGSAFGAPVFPEIELPFDLAEIVAALVAFLVVVIFVTIGPKAAISVAMAAVYGFIGLIRSLGR